MMKKGWGRVINVASIAGKTGAPYIAAYSASKHGVMGLTRSIALAAAKHAVYMSESSELETMLRYETEAQLRCFDSDDGHEGIRAFLEKREPRFTGH